MANTTSTTSALKNLLGRVITPSGVSLDRFKPIPAKAVPFLIPLDISYIYQRFRRREFQTEISTLDKHLGFVEGQAIGLSGYSRSETTAVAGTMARAGYVTVIALVGAAPKDLVSWKRQLGKRARENAIVICSMSRDTPQSKVHGVLQAVRIADTFAEKGCQVLLIIDSVDRLAAAQRQIGMQEGEEANCAGYTRSVFVMVAKLLGQHGVIDSGSLTQLAIVHTNGTNREAILHGTLALADGYVELGKKSKGKIERAINYVSLPFRVWPVRGTSILEDRCD